MFLGGVTDQGYVAENRKLKEDIFQRNKHMMPMSMDEVYAILKTFCLPMKPKPSSRDAQDQEVVTSLNPPAHWKHTVDMVPFTMRQPFWRY